MATKTCAESTEICREATSTGNVTTQHDLKETVEGYVSASDSVAGNTIVVADQDVEDCADEVNYKHEELMRASSTEPLHRFNSLSDRWIKIDTRALTASKFGDIVFQMEFPRSLYNNEKCSPNVLPFEQFIYGSFDIELRFVVASTRNICGRYVASLIPDPSQLWDGSEQYYSIYSALARNHVFIDVNNSQTSTMKLNWMYHRSFIRLDSNYNGVDPMCYMKVIVQCLAPVRSIDGAVASAQLTTMARIVDAHYAAMSYSKATKQVFSIKSIRNVVNEATQAYEGISGEFVSHKPSVFLNTVYVVPTPRMFMSPARTLSDAVPMRLDPSRLTVFSPSHKSMIQYTDVRQIARRWGLIGAYNWSTDIAAGSEILKLTVDPTCVSWLDEPLDARHLTPMESIANMYMYYSGCWELRLDFVKTIFHSGVVSVSVEFGRPSDEKDECQSQSTYVKTFQVGDQASFKITIPYIYDTVMRRLRNIPVFSTYRSQETAIRSGLVHAVKGQIKVRVLSPLVAQGVSKTINVLAFCRAAPNMNFKCAIQNNAAISTYMAPLSSMHSWPPIGSGTKEDYISGERYISRSKATIYPKLDTIAFGSRTTMSRKEMDDTHKTLTTRLQTYKITGTLPAVSTDGSFKHHHLRHRANFQVGPSENLDSTSDHACPSITGMLTKEIHTNISDILKKPVMIMHEALVQPCIPTSDWTQPESVFVIPCMPPQPNMFNPVVPDMLCAGAIQSPHVLLTSMHRFWRGGQRYVIIFKEIDTNPVSVIRVGYVPHSGVRILGNTTSFYGQDTKDEKTTDLAMPLFSMANAGIPFELVVPSINQTYSVEVPYYHEANWCLLHQGLSPNGSNATGPVRDRMDENTGHIIIESKSKLVIDVLWMAADDFQLAGYIGTPGCIKEMLCYRNDNYEVVTKDNTVDTTPIPNANLQSASSINPTLSKDDFRKLYSGNLPQAFSQDGVVDFLMSYKRPILLAAASYVMPSLTLPLAVLSYGSTFAKLENVVNNVDVASVDVPMQAHKLTRAAEDLMSDVSLVANSFRGHMNNTANGVNMIVSQCLDIVRSIGATVHGIDVESVIITLGVDLTELLTGFNWQSFIRMVVRVLVGLKILTLGLVSQCVQALLSISRFAIGIAQLQEDTDSLSRSMEIFSSLLLSGVCTSIGVTVMHGFDVSRMFVNFLSIRNLSATLRISAFMSDLVKAIKTMYCWVIGQVSPEAEALRVLSERREFIAKFVEEAKLFLSDTDVNFLRSPRGKVRYWMTLCNAMQIQGMMIHSPEDRVSPALLALCGSVVRKGTSITQLMMAAPVRYEPFVIMLEGDPGIGKSYMVMDMVVDMLSAAGIKTNTTDVLFTRCPGPAFWNGFSNDHLAVLYDDFLNLRSEEACVEQIGELYTLKSPATFNPNMARLEDKDLRANPLIVVLATNNAFPSLDVVRNSTAFRRRVDMCVRVECSSQYSYQRSVRELPSEVLATSAHLEFKEYTNYATGSSSLTDVSVGYGRFKEILVSRFSSYHSQEKRNVLQRIETLQRLLPDNAMRYNVVGDPFSLFYRTMFDLSASMQPDVAPSVSITERVAAFEEQLDSIPTIQEQINSIVVPETVPFQQTESFGSLCLRAFNSSAYNFRMSTRKFLASLCGIASADLVQCSVCGNQGVNVLSCANSTEENQHAVCQNCAVTQMQVNYRFFPHCPVCRGPVELSVSSGVWSRSMSLFRLSGGVMMSLLYSLHGIAMAAGACVFESYLFRMMTLGYLFIGTNPVLSMISRYSFYANVCFNLYPDLYEAHITANQGMLETMDRTSEWVQDSYFDAVEEQCNMCVFDSFEIDSSIHPREVCMHVPGVIANATYVGREDGGYFLTPIGDRITPWPCSNSCLWADHEVHRSALLTWFHNNHVTIRSMVCEEVARSRTIQVWRVLPLCMKVRPAVTDSLAESIRNFACEWWQYLDTKMRDTCSWIYSNIYVMGGIATAVALFAACVYYLRNESVVPQSRSTVGSSTSSRVSRPRIRGNVHASSQGPQETRSTLERYISNMGNFAVYNNGEVVLYAGFVGICERWAIIPQHLIVRMKENPNYVIEIRVAKRPNVSFKVDIFDLEFIEFDNSDMARFCVPACYPLFHDLTRYMPTIQELSDEGISSEGLLIEQPRVMDSVYAITIHDIQFYDFVTELEVVGTGGCKIVHDVVHYNYSQPGACGSFVLCKGSRHPLVGVHIAGMGVGASGDGYAMALFQEMFDGLSRRIKGVADRAEIHVTTDPVTCLEDVVLMEHGIVDDNLSMNVPTITSILPSMIAKGLPRPQTSPVILSPKDPRFQEEWDSPLIAGVKKQGKVTGHMKSASVKKAYEFLKIHLQQFGPIKSGKKYQTPLTPEEAVLGTGEPYYDAIDLSTSPGWPWNVTRLPKGKLIDVDWDQRKVVLHDALSDMLEQERAIRREGYVLPTLFGDVLKDERKTNDKIYKEGGARLINCSPIQYTIAVRQLWQHFTASMIKNRIKNWMAIGVNPDGPEWAEVLSHLKCKNKDKCVALDYKNFGPSFSSQALEMVIRAMMDWLDMHSEYTDAEKLEAEILLREAQNSFHIKNNVVYQQFSGAPSGNPLTSLLNSLVNIFYLVYVWFETGVGDVEKLCDSISVLVYGDDMIMAVKEDVVEDYNGEIIQSVLKKSNIHVTPPDKKEGRVQATLPYNDINFLKRGFMKHPKREMHYLAPLDWISIEECAKWVKKKEPLKEATKVNAHMSIRMAYTHGPEKFDKWKNRVNKLLSKAHIPMYKHSWDDIDAECFDQGEALIPCYRFN